MAKPDDIDWARLPEPEDDGTAAHLEGMTLPSVPLKATDGCELTLATLRGLSVIYIYPMTSRPDTPPPDDWDEIPGARGCTPQSCAFRDHFAELRKLGVKHLLGLSTQTSEYQAEAAERLHLPFPLLSDSDLAFARAMKLPTFDVAGMTLLKRLTMIVRDGTVIRVFYPVFPPDRSAEDVLDWLRSDFRG